MGQLIHGFNFSHIRGEVRANEAMSQHTTWRVGGLADIYFKPADKEDLVVFLKIINNKLKIFWLGLGSNVLFADSGYRGVVINAVGQLNQIEYLQDKLLESKFQQVKVAVGVSCNKFAREMAKRGLLGAEFFAGIPGSIGGALAMNAGAFCGSCWDLVKQVETIDDRGNIRVRDKSEFNISYRKVLGLKNEVNKQQEWFLNATFNYPQDMNKVLELKQHIKQLMSKRNETQPINTANAGSVFKNPPGDYAARLIESCGLKNKTIGGAVVSEKHANFIINRGNATAADIIDLIKLVKKTVYEKTSCVLECEVKLIKS